MSNDASKHNTSLTDELAELKEQNRRLKEIELALKNSEQRLADTIDFLPDPTFAIDSEGKVLIWNKAIEEMTGVKAGEILGKGDREYSRLFYNTKRPMLIDLILSPDEEPDTLFPVFIRKGDAIEAEGFVKVAFGSGSAYFWGRASLLYDERGEVVGAIESLRDITEKKLLDGSLCEQHEWFKTTLESIGDAVIATDEQSRITFMNQAAERLTGYSQEESFGRPIQEVFNIINEETGAPAVIPTDKVLRDGVIMGLADHTALIAKDGTVRPIADSAAPIRNEAGKTVGVVLVFRDESERKRSEMALRKSEEQFRNLIENMNDVFFRLDGRGNFVYISSGVENLGEYKKEQFIGLNIFDFVHQDDKKRVEDALQKNLAGLPGTIEFRVITQSGVKYVTVSSKLVHEDGIPYVFGVLTDITKRKLAELELEKSEELYKAMVMDQSEMISRFLPGGVITFINNSLCKASGYSKEEIIGHNVRDFFPLPVVEKVLGLLNLLNRENPTATYETPFIRANGEERCVQWVTRKVYYETGQGFEYQSVGRDITERMQAEKKLKHMSMHDSLTGLHNRAFFEEAMEKLEGEDCFPLGIIVCDLDGLKLVNDTFGHHTGDKMLTEIGGIMKKCFRKDDVVARIGGDEFAVILTSSSAKDVENSCRRILDTVDGYNKLNPDLPVNLSVGYAVAATKTGIDDVFKEADNNMYREKLHRSQSTRSAIVNTLMKTLEARDIITNDHSLRIQDLLVNLARNYNFPKLKLNDLKLLAKFHDIGKVGIPDRILLKPGPLTAEEMAEMQRHCEIGHRIALAASDLAPIADWIIKHHEWWNGEGYPLGLKEEEIPLECRMLAVVDAYEAMMSDRPYRKAMTFEDAVDELKRCSGTQFDPVVIQKFLRIIRKPRKRKKV